MFAQSRVRWKLESVPEVGRCCCDDGVEMNGDPAPVARERGPCPGRGRGRAAVVAARVL